VRKPSPVAARSKIYVWFGVPADKIPYTVGAGAEKTIDVEVLRRGGKTLEQ
jgi:hypothetical protein